MIASLCTRALATFAAVAMTVAAFGAHAQTGQGTPNVLQGFNQNRDKPVQIRAQTFEVRDKEKVAAFSGNVHVVQGDTIIRCKSLIVTYETASGAGARASQPGPAGRSQISRLEALGGVIVTQKDQTATGDSGLFDLRTNIITLSGNVVVSQGGNVMRGERLVVDLNAGVSRVESGKKRGQVEMLVPQSQQNGAKPGAQQREMPRLDLLRPAQQN
jgi:lipopolysaccharide export system protein LptA